MQIAIIKLKRLLLLIKLRRYQQYALQTSFATLLFFLLSKSLVRNLLCKPEKQGFIRLPGNGKAFPN